MSTNTGFTRHAQKRLKQRHISHDEIRRSNSALLCVIRSEENDVITAYRVKPPKLRKFKGLGNFANPSTKMTLEKSKFLLFYNDRGYCEKFKKKYHCNLIWDKEAKTVTIIAPCQFHVDNAKFVIQRYAQTSVLPFVGIV